MKIATWNVNSLKVRLPQLLNWLTQEQPDIMALQETKLIDEAFPLAAIQEAGYQAIFHGQKTYNGVAVLSKKDLQQVEPTPAFFPDQQARLLAATIDDVRIINVYVPNGASVDSDKYFYKLKWLEALYTYLQQQFLQYEKVVVLGDFNIAPTDNDVHDPIAWQGQVLVSERERAALTEIMQLGFVDSFRLHIQEPGHFSWWDYRAASFRRNNGLRIDLILASKVLSEKCRTCVIDKILRQNERPSDHVPVWIELD